MLILLPRRDATGTVDGDKARKDTIPDRLGYFLHGVLVRGVGHDDPLIAMSTVDMLEDRGHIAIEANSGKRALEIIDAGKHIT